MKQIFFPLDSIPQTLIKAVLAAEDDGFYMHPGFDLVAILHAYEYNKSKNKFKRGASTITQQMAKNIFTGGEKSFSRKYNELAYTVLMEAILGKDRILELYLNYAQWGKNIFGCEAASHYYYKKSCKDLTITQCSRLAAVLAKPARLNPHSTKSILLQKRLKVIGNNLYYKKIIDDTTYVGLTGSDSLVVLKQIKRHKKDSLTALKDTTQNFTPSINNEMQKNTTIRTSKRLF